MNKNDYEKIKCTLNNNDYNIPWSLLLTILMEYAHHEPNNEEILVLEQKLQQYKVD